MYLPFIARFGHKDVKAISMHVSTRNATQVRTHAQKYFLRLERERRKRTDEEGKDILDGYNSSGDDMYHSDNGSPMEELSPPTMSIASPPHPANVQMQPQQQQPTPPVTRRRRSTSLISPVMGKYVIQYQTSVLAELPSWSVEDYELFSKGLISVLDKQDDIGQVCRTIRDGFLPHRSIEDVEACYKLLHKLIKSKPVALVSQSIGSPKRRRTSKPELPISMPQISEGPLPAIAPIGNTIAPAANNTINAGNNFTTFMANMPSALPPPPQYLSTNNLNMANSSVSLLPFQPPQLNGMMNMNLNMNMRPIVDYNTMPSMQSLPIHNMGLGLGNMTMMDIGSPNLPSNHATHWNSLALSFDLHQNSPSALSLPQGAPLISSLN